MSQQSPWGSRLTLSTNVSITSPNRTTFSPGPPTNPLASSHLSSSGRQNASRTSSVSSQSSPFSPSHAGSQQPPPGQLLASARTRTIASSSASQLASSAAGLSLQVSVGGSSGGGTAKLARRSPSLSQSSGIGSPINPANTTSAPAQSQSLSKIVIAQIFLLLGTIKEDKDKTKSEAQTEQLRRLIDSHGMEVFSKYFRRLLQTNAAHVFSSSGKSTESSGNYQILVGEMQQIRQDPQQAYKIAESIDTPEGDIFRDFDVSSFMDHFKLDPIAKTILALAFKSASKPDLRTKADAILWNNFESFINTIIDPTAEPLKDLPTSYLVTVLDRLLQDLPRNWNEDSRQHLSYALSQRYRNLDIPLPAEIQATMQLADLLGAANPLVRLVQRVGLRGTSSLEACRDMLASAETRDIHYTQVANVLLFMVITQNGQAYSPSTFVAALREHRSGKRLDWQDVVHAFDRPGLRITKTQFLALYSALVPLAREYENFDVQLLWGGNWSNVETQLSFVVALLSCSEEELDASDIPRLRKAFTLDFFEHAPDEAMTFATKAVKHPLVSLDATTALFQVIFQTQESYITAQSLGIPDTVINPHTDIFLVSASAVKKPWGGLQEAAAKQLVQPFLERSLPNYDFVLHGLWHHDKHWLAQRLVGSYSANPTFLPVIFDHAQKHGWLGDLATINTDMSLDLATLAHGRGVLDLASWAEQAAQKPGFSQALAQFLSFKAEQETRTQRENADAVTVPLTVKTVHVLLDFLQGHLPDEDLVQLQRVSIQAYPRVVNYGEGFDDVLDASGNGRTGNSIPGHADEQMQEFFKKLYAGDIDVNELIEELRKYKHSEDPGDQDLFAITIMGLFDEYNCFGEYPKEALAITSVLFGGLISYNLLPRIALQVGLAMVLEAVQTYTNEDSMYKFGLQALLQFPNRLQEWPSYCERLLRVTELQGTDIWPVAEEIVRKHRGGDLSNGGELNGDISNGLLANGNASDPYGIEPLVPEFTCLHVDPPSRPDFYEVPDEEVQDKVLFTLNNISERNLIEKLKDVKEPLEEKHFQWFAAYLVEERAKLQPNFQQLYLDMLELFDEKTLSMEILRETYVAVIRMLNAESTMSSSTERSHLKNLGGWLGSLTIAKDRAIKWRNISLKDLLIEGYDTHRLLIVIPFTCKVLSQASHSTVFRPPNPWLMELVGLLMELYHYDESLKLNLKFEIEVLCKSLDLDHATIEAANLIRARVVLPDQDFGGPVMQDGVDGFNELSLVQFNRAGVRSERFSEDKITSAIPDFSNMLIYPPSSSRVLGQDRLREIFLLAAQSAIQEIIAPVVERSVTIAAICTSQLVTKDFATEADEERFRDAAHNMVKALSGSLALVTCKEPLRMSITNNIRALARQLPDQALPEGLILMFVNDNLDTVCNTVEQAAENASLDEIEMQIDEGLRLRQLHRAQHPDERFMFPPVPRWAVQIPEPYRVSAGGLNREQTAIYEDFARQPRGIAHIASVSQDSGRQMSDILQDQFSTVPSLPTPAEAPAIPRQGPQQQQQRMPLQPPLAQLQLNGYMGAISPEDHLYQLLQQLQNAAKEASEESTKDLGEGSLVKEYYRSLLGRLEITGTHRDVLAAMLAQKITTTFYSAYSRRIEYEVMVQVLCALCQLSVEASKHISTWVAGIDNEDFPQRLYDSSATISLLAFDLIDIQRVDTAIARYLRQRRKEALDCFSDLLDALLFTEEPTALRTDFARSFEALTYWRSEEPEFDLPKILLAKLNSQQGGDALPTPPLGNKEDQVIYVFEEWVHLTRQDSTEKAAAVFVYQLQESQLLKDKETYSYFLRMCIDISVRAYEAQEALAFGSLDHAYLAVDALARLIVRLVIYQGEAEGAVKANKATILDAVLSLVILIACDHQRVRGERFNQKIFYRLFCSILCELHACTTQLAGFEKETMLVVGRAFLALQPNYFPTMAFSWLALIAHRNFMPAMLKMPDQAGWDIFTKLTETFLKFAGELIKPREVSVLAREYYRAVLRVLLVLHHDFPEFLAENHVRLSNSIPVHCVQLRNLVISAYPSAMADLPDPFANGLKVDRIEDIRKTPTIRGDLEAPLRSAGIKDAVDALLADSEAGNDNLKKICRIISQNPRHETGFDFAPVTVDTALINTLVLYIGTKAIPSSLAKGPTFSKTSPPARMLNTMTRELRPEARYHFISAIVNQLRYPNSHTHYFSYALLDLFGFPNHQDSETCDVQQQITRVLLERLLVHRPHPWGLIITLLELLKNQQYEFWELPFVKSAPEVERYVSALFNQINQSPRALA